MKRLTDEPLANDKAQFQLQTEFLEKKLAELKARQIELATRDGRLQTEAKLKMSDGRFSMEERM